MNLPADLYDLLAVSRTATPAEIRDAYRALVTRFHPDKHTGNPLENLASEKVAQLNHAYEVLSDPTRRAQYDAGPSVDVHPARHFLHWPSKPWRIAGVVLLLLILMRFGGTFVRAVGASPWLLLVLVPLLAFLGTRWARARRAR